MNLPIFRPHIPVQGPPRGCRPRATQEPNGSICQFLLGHIPKETETSLKVKIFFSQRKYNVFLSVLRHNLQPVTPLSPIKSWQNATFNDNFAANQFLKIMRLNITTITAIALMALTSSHVVAQDIVVNYRTTDGKIESTTVDRKQLPEVRKFMQAGIPLPAEQKRLLKSPAKSPDPGTETPEGFKVTFAVENENPEGYTYEPWKVYVTQPDGEFGEGYYNYAYYPDEWMIEQGIGWWGCYIPEGTYSLILATARRYDNTDDYYNAYIVKTNVTIDRDITFTFRQSEAKNLLTAKFLYHDGSEMEEPTKETYEHYNYGYFYPNSD